MVYKYCDNKNFEDLASGRVIAQRAGFPNFPVRLAQEIFGRCCNYLGTHNRLCIYDPCCGGGYALTVLGFFHNRDIRKIYGSDIDESMVLYAKKNVALLTDEGMDRRQAEIRQLYDEYGKNSHLEALHSCDQLRNMLVQDMPAEIFRADSTKALPKVMPDIIFTDIPYGNLVRWDNDEGLSLDSMLEQLWLISHEKTILAVCMDKKQRIRCDRWKRLERQNIGKRRFEILKREASVW